MYGNYYNYEVITVFNACGSDASSERELKLLKLTSVVELVLAEDYPRLRYLSPYELLSANL